MKDRRTLANDVSKRYKNAGKKEKKQILDEFTANTGYTRKYAIHLLANWD
ncbi:MAG: transposase, partial [Treponema sp.]|nr:transposase [Treponema sp.]